MAEDIDIEEHDLLQNPMIQQIFPDLSVLKQEIMDFDEDFSENATNSKETGTGNLNISDTSTSSDFAPNFCRKIILGSKPSKGTMTKNLTLISDLKIMLQNIRPYLTRTKRFCDKCLILFPHKQSLIDHELSIHAILDYNSKQKHPISPGYKKKVMCSLCQGEFTNKFSLWRHERNIHNIDQDERCNKGFTSQIKENNVVDKSFEAQTNYIFSEACFHCDELFPNQQDLIDHLYAILYTKKAQVPIENVKEKGITQVEKLMGKHNEIFEKNVTNMSTDEKMNKKKKVSESKNVYSCPICSYYFNEEVFCKSHAIAKHKGFKNMQINMSLFNPMCKFCDSKLDDIMTYNTHLRINHKTEMLKQVNSILPFNNQGTSKCCNLRLPEHGIVEIYPKHGHLTTFAQNSESQNHEKQIYNDIQVMVSKIILFKCSECNIHFLTSYAASKHLDHLIFKINWECVICHRLFKDKDATIHQEQHQYSKYFVVMNVLAEVQPTTLYKCPMCAVHLSKTNFAKHCTICEYDQTRSADSLYCKVCDIFIESSIKSSHDNDHNLRNLTPSDIKIIDSESLVINNKNHNDSCLDDRSKVEKPYLPDSMINNQEKFTNIQVDNKFRDITTISNLSGVSAKQLSYNFCNICKCNISRVFKTDVHLKSLCVNIVKYICKFCGLLFSNKSITSHRKLHQQYKTLKLQDLTFYNLHTNKIMKPLIPEFPKCELCEKHFTSKAEVKGHLCDINDYFTCCICKTKFSETAYKLHMPFHCYKLKSKCKQSDKLVHKITYCEDLIESNKNISSKDGMIPAIYTCKNCNVSLSTYDDVIEHCHIHTNLNKVQVNSVECTTCQMKFDCTSFMKHVELHKNYENIRFRRFNFDLSYFGSDKWLQHVYKSLSKYEFTKLIGDSIYRYETRIKMEVTQEGPSNLTIYKCEKCQCIIDCNSTYSHIVTCCPNSEVSDCTFCDLSFACSTTRNDHEKIHVIPDITVQSYRIVMFNRKQDRNINDNISNFKKCYVVYECRFCHVLVERCDYVYHICFRNDCKKCNVCGLLLYAEHWDDHIFKHKQIRSFNENKIKVVLIGNNTEESNILTRHNILLPTFNGIVCDYTFYKCIDCEVCVRDVRNTVHHSCLIDAAKSQCTKCDLIFEEGKLKGHLKLHDTDPDFTKETILVKPFTNRKKSENFVKTKNVFAVEIEKNGQSSNENITNVINHKIAKLYKCSCGLHYVQQSSLQEHIMKKCSVKNKSKQSIQNCSKCGLSFTSDVLFRHIIEHHGDKNVVFEYEIVEILPDEMDNTMSN